VATPPSSASASLYEAIHGHRTLLHRLQTKDYERFHQKGRMLPQGLTCINSWLAKDGDRCFQLMETADPSLFETWMENWKDLLRLEIVELGDKPKS
jgi:hypothetical protein